MVVHQAKAPLAEKAAPPDEGMEPINANFTMVSYSVSWREDENARQFCQGLFGWLF
jgi:hypothetical protein